jgi:hypothetical protein
MAGGTGGTGGSPNGVPGSPGSTQPQGSLTYEGGGTGGNNGLIFIDGSTKYGPYGYGGNGAGTDPTFSSAGNSGAVFISWGGGNSGQLELEYPQIIVATSAGISEGGGGPTGSPGYMYNTNNAKPVLVQYGPVSPHYEAGGSFSWNTCLAFIGANSNVTDSDMNNWGFDPSSVLQASAISLISFSAGIDSSYNVGYAFVNHGATDLSQAYGYNIIGSLSDPIPDRHFRSSNTDPYAYGANPYGLGPWNLPVPGPNTLMYIWTQDGSGSDTRTITVSCTV